VCALLAGGGYAQRVAVPVGQVMPRPYGLDGTTSASLPEVACTAWSNLINVADLSRDEFVLIHGGAGGVGSHAIQLAKALGARVATTAGSPEKLALCQKLGADVVINYRDQDFVGVIKSATGGRGANVVLDNMGAKYLARNVDVLAVGGRLVIIGMQGGIKGELNIATLLSKLGTVSATSLRSRPIDDKTDICQAVHEVVWPMIESGRVKPIIDSVMSISEVVAAHERMESGDHTGKIVLTLP
jgi:putative PIG3 family NAD(P)H quinone oxidoreductase